DDNTEEEIPSHASQPQLVDILDAQGNMEVALFPSHPRGKALPNARLCHGGTQHPSTLVVWSTTLSTKILPMILSPLNLFTNE
ncbi:hypothetical protein SK128_007344, partial [Halocaridina rubra]